MTWNGFKNYSGYRRYPKKADKIADWETACIYDRNIVIGFAMYRSRRRKSLPKVLLAMKNL